MLWMIGYFLNNLKKFLLFYSSCSIDFSLELLKIYVWTVLLLICLKESCNTLFEFHILTVTRQWIFALALETVSYIIESFFLCSYKLCGKRPRVPILGLRKLCHYRSSWGYHNSNIVKFIPNRIPILLFGYKNFYSKKFKYMWVNCCIIE